MPHCCAHRARSPRPPTFFAIWRKRFLLRQCLRFSLMLLLLAAGSSKLFAAFDAREIVDAPVRLPTRHAVKGQLLMKLNHRTDLSQQKQAVTMCAVCAQAFRRSSTTYTSDASSSLDRLIDKHHATFRAPIFRQESGKPASPDSETVAALQAEEQAKVRAVRNRYGKRAARANGTSAMPEGLFHWYVVDVDETMDPAEACKEWQADSHVAACHPNYLFRTLALPTDPYVSTNGTTWSTGAFGQSYANLWGLQRIRAVDAWPVSDGTGVVVAVVDSGLDYTHPDIAGSGSVNNVWVNSEDLNKNGRLDAGEDQNRNGRLDCLEDANCNGRPEFTSSGQGGDLDGIDADDNGLMDDVSGYDFTTCDQYVGETEGPCAAGKAKVPDRDAKDEHGHGTHVAGTIGALRNNNQGISGVAPGAKIMPIRILNAQGQGSSADGAAGLRYAVDQGADILNNSWGDPADNLDLPVLQDALNYAQALGAVSVFAAGNSSMDLQHDDGSPQFCPACFDNVIAVGASTDAERKADFSNFGKRIDLVAPGGSEPLTSGLGLDNVNSILSLRAAGTTLGPLVGVPGSEQYVRVSGTSMAAPHVSGGAALVLGSHPGEPFTDVNGNGVWNAGEPYSDVGVDGKSATVDYGQGNGRYDAFTNEDVRAALRSSAIDVEESGRDTFSGFGRLDALQAVQAQPRQHVSVVPIGRVQNIQVGQAAFPLTVTIENTWLSTQGLSATLISDDPSLVKVLSPATQSYGTLTLPRQRATRTYQLQVITWMTQLRALPLRLRVSGTNGFPMTDIPVRVSFVPTLPGWPVSTPCGFGTIAPLLADLDRDGDEEIIIGDVCGTLHAWNSNGTPLAGWPVTVGVAGQARLIGSPAAADVDRDPAKDLEIVIAVADGTVYAFHHDDRNSDGKPDLVAGWPRQLPSFGPADPFPAGISLADVDGNGTVEVIATSEAVGANPARVDVLRADGASTPGWPQLLPSGVDTTSLPAAVGDFESDGKLEIVVNTTVNDATGRVYAWRFNGAAVPGWPRTTTTLISDSVPALADLDGQVGAEVVVAARQQVYVWKGSTGALLSGWPVNIGTDVINSVRSSPTVANLDGTGLPEVLAVTAFGNVYAWHSNGTPVPGWPQRTRGFVFLSSPVVADLDGIGTDRLPEVIVGGGFGDGRFYAWHHDGRPVDGWPIPIDGAWALTTASVADVDRNGALNLFLASTIDGTIHGFDLVGRAEAAFPPPWPTLHHDVQRTGSAQFSPVPLPPKYPVFAPPPPSTLSVLENSALKVLFVATDPDANLRTLTMSGLPTGATLTLLGDVNADGQFTEADTVLVTKFILGTQTPTATQRILADLDDNGVLNIADAVILVNVTLNNQRRGLFRWTPTKNQGRTAPYTMSCVVTDADSLTAPHPMAITVIDPTPPTVTVDRCKPSPFGVCQAASGSVSSGGSFVFRVKGSDPDPDPLIFTAQSIVLIGNAAFLPLGDVTRDNVLSSLDVTYIAQYRAGTRTFTQEQKWLADVNQDGLISSADELMITQVLNGTRAPLKTYLFFWTPASPITSAFTHTVTFQVSDGTNVTTRTMQMPISP